MRKQIVLGLHGIIGSGKSETALFLKNKLSFKVYSFATPLKEACKKIFLFTDIQMSDRVLKEQVDPRWGISPRQAFRLIGHGFRESVVDDIWIRHMQYTIENHFKTFPECSVVIDDVRYQNEIDFIESLPSGTVLKVYRPENPSEKIASDVSDTQQTTIASGITIVNDADLQVLRVKLLFALYNIGYFEPAVFEAMLTKCNKKFNF